MVYDPLAAIMARIGRLTGEPSLAQRPLAPALDPE